MKFTRAAVFEPSATRGKRIAQGLTKAGLRVRLVQRPEELEGEQLVVLGPTLKGAPGVARAVRNQLQGVLLLAAQEKGFRASFADAVLPLPVSPNDLKVRLIEHAARRRAQQVQLRAGEGIVDPLTGFYTFAHFKEVVFVEVKRARRYGFPLSIALVSVDPLGQPLSGELGARMMGGVALAIRRCLRDTDYPVQYGAEKILLLMPHTDLAGATVVSGRIVERVARATLTHGEEVLRPTISAGVASGISGREYSFADLVRGAQEALSAAWANGGNRVEFFDAAIARGSDAKASAGS